MLNALRLPGRIAACYFDCRWRARREIVNSLGIAFFFLLLKVDRRHPEVFIIFL